MTIADRDKLRPIERVTILAQRIWNLRHGAGEHTEAEREEEILRAQDALRQAYRDHHQGIGA